MRTSEVPQAERTEQTGLTCPGSGTLPDIFDDVDFDVRFGACPVCGLIESGSGVVSDH